MWTTSFPNTYMAELETFMRNCCTSAVPSVTIKYSIVYHLLSLLNDPGNIAICDAQRESSILIKHPVADQELSVI